MKEDYGSQKWFDWKLFRDAKPALVKQLLQEILLAVDATEETRQRLLNHLSQVFDKDVSHKT